MLKNIFLKTLRDYRWQILIWGGGFALLMVSVLASYSTLIGGPGQPDITSSLQKAAESFSFITGKVYDLGTFSGYTSYQFSRLFSLFLPLFGVLAGSNLIRGEEEKGSLDVLLGTPHSRTSYFLQKWGGFIVAILAITGFSWIGVAAGTAASPGQSLDIALALAALVNTALPSIFFAALALLFSQFTTRKASAGWAGGSFAASFLLNNLSLNLTSFKWIRVVSPFYYESLSRPLVPTVGINLYAVAVLLFLPLPTLGAALWFFLKRDLGDYYRFTGKTKIGAAITDSPGYKPVSLWFSGIYPFAVRAAFWPTIAWSSGLSFYIFLNIAVLRDLRETFLNLLKSDLYLRLGFQKAATNENLLSISLFVFAVLLYAAFAVTQTSSWTGEENEGRLELLLSLPHSRKAFLVYRFAAFMTNTAVLLFITLGSFELASFAFQLDLDQLKVTGAFLSLWILQLLVGAGGYLLAALDSGKAIALLIGLVIISYLLELLSNLLKLPAGLVNISIFHQFGQPLVNGFNWTSQICLLAVALFFVGLAVFLFSRRDLKL